MKEFIINGAILVTIVVSIFGMFISFFVGLPTIFMVFHTVSYKIYCAAENWVEPPKYINDMYQRASCQNTKSVDILKENNL